MRRMQDVHTRPGSLVPDHVTRIVRTLLDVALQCNKDYERSAKQAVEVAEVDPCLSCPHTWPVHLVEFSACGSARICTNTVRILPTYRVFGQIVRKIRALLEQFDSVTKLSTHPHVPSYVPITAVQITQTSDNTFLHKQSSIVCTDAKQQAWLSNEIGHYEIRVHMHTVYRGTTASVQTMAT